MYASLARIYHLLQKMKRKRYIQGLKRSGMHIGENVDIIGDSFFDPSHCYLISVGDNCTICPNVRLIAHDASTKKLLGYTKIGKIEIRENCFLGDSVIVLPNVTIGPDSVVGAGSVVTRTIPPGVVATGNPARIRGTLMDYIQRMSMALQESMRFGEEYKIDQLDERKRKQLLSAVAKSTTFIR